LKVYLDAPHALIREGLTLLLEQRHEMTSEALAEVAIKDLSRYRFPYPPPPSLPTLALLCNDDEQSAPEILRIGYRGYLRCGDGRACLEQALQALLRGENWAERSVIADVLYRQNKPSLTHREKEVYTLTLQGPSNQEIAESLELSVHTVKVHVSKLLQKLQAKSRRELIIQTKAVFDNPLE
jgi:DNA-binding NarL/FixJ family response regulator